MVRIVNVGAGAAGRSGGTEQAQGEDGATGFPAHRQVSYTKLGEHRGLPRLWLEGARLERCGFEPGSRFRVDLDLVRRQVRLLIDANGDRQVSSRKARGSEEDRRTPIVDVTADSLSNILGEGARVRAVLSPGEIVFDLHPVQLAIEAREKRTQEHVANGYVTEAALCAGVGVATLALKEGLESAGLQTRVDWIIDRDGRYLDLAVQNNPAITNDTRLYEASLEEVETAALNGTDILQVSLPCTLHSTAGKAKRKLQKAEDHPTDALGTFGLLRILEAVNPSVVVSENVKQARESASYALVRAYLHEQGYSISEGVFGGKQAGSIEHRERWWFCAISSGLAQGFDIANVRDQPRTFATLGEALDAIDDEDGRWRTYDYLEAKAVRDAAAGKGFKRQLVGPEAERIGTVTRGYNKARSTDPMVRHPDGVRSRLLTPNEHARVKGIPEQLVEGAGATLAHEVLGQSILFGHAKGIGQSVGEHLARRCVEDEDDPSVRRPR